MSQRDLWSDVEYICLSCPLPPDDCTGGGVCPYGRLRSLQRRERVAHLAGRDWISQTQVRHMLAELSPATKSEIIVE